MSAMTTRRPAAESTEQPRSTRKVLYPYLNFLLRFVGYIVPVLPSQELADVVMRRFGPAAPPLEVRAKQVGEALAKAAELLDELQAEVKLRAVIIKQLEEQTVEAGRRSEDAVLRAALNEEQAKAVDTYLDRALQARLRELEKNARRREVMLGTVVALIVGIATIFISHYLFDF